VNNPARGYNSREMQRPIIKCNKRLCLKTRRLFVTDRNTKINFLIDMGADLCVYPRKFIRNSRYKSDYELSAANKTIIKTYDTELLILNLGLRRDFTWRFVVADVSKSTIGAVVVIRDLSEHILRFWDHWTDHYFGSSDVDLGRKAPFVKHRWELVIFIVVFVTSNN